MMNEIALEDRIVVHDTNIDELNEFVIDHEENIQDNSTTAYKLENIDVDNSRERYQSVYRLCFAFCSRTNKYNTINSRTLCDFSDIDRWNLSFLFAWSKNYENDVNSTISFLYFSSNPDEILDI
ncbi:unnamed protein product [Brachionus calyciflorus]|uniref:Uncharacterized protein n=1 Tax=Brachionus calyciflorus TaxID=104777 RepID=A0A814CFP3_9BILA|nr:unnamed protein product [Brachionus calyciflorus]